MSLPDQPDQPDQPEPGGGSGLSPLAPDPGTSDSPAGSRLRTVSWLGGLAIAGLAAGIIAGRVTGAGPGTVALRPSQVVATGLPATAVTTTLAPSTLATTAPSPTTAEPTPEPTTPSAKPADYSPIPADATQESDLDFGFLTGVQKNGDLVTITFDRASFLTGDAATRANGGKGPDNDYLIVNQNSKTRTFTVAAKAPLLGVSRLLSSTGGPITQVKIASAAFVANATKALAGGEGIPVWVRHSVNSNGPVTSLAEQYTP